MPAQPLSSHQLQQIDQEYAKFGLSQSDFSSFILSLHTDASSILHNELLFTNSQTTPSLNLSDLTDDLQNRQPSFSFLSITTNGLSTPAGIRGVTNILANYRANLKPHGLPDKNVYHNAIEKFLELMLLLFLLTGGQPDQGPEIFARESSEEVPAELISISHSNGAALPPDEVSHRTIFIDGGMVCICTADHNHSAGLRMRFLPPEVSESMVLYLACVLPFLRSLNRDDIYGKSEWLFAHPLGTWHTARYHRILARETKARLGKEWDIELANKLIVNVQRAMGNKVGP